MICPVRLGNGGVSRGNLNLTQKKKEKEKFERKCGQRLINGSTTDLIKPKIIPT